MTDYILKSEVTEHINNRQTAKILYLQQELLQAQDQIKDLEYMLKLNKEALRLSIEEKNLENQNDSPESMNTGIKSRETAISSYFIEENRRMITRLEALSKDRNLAQSRVISIYEIYSFLRL